jgi:hypothetical protein
MACSHVSRRVLASPSELLRQQNRLKHCFRYPSIRRMGAYRISSVTDQHAAAFRLSKAGTKPAYTQVIRVQFSLLERTR